MSLWTFTPAHRQALINRSTVLLVLVMGSLVASTHWLTFNIEPSIPYGLYRVVPRPEPLERGMLVRLKAPAVMHPWHPFWLSLTKPVAAVEGDWACVGTALWREGERWLIHFADETEMRLSVNGHDYGPVYREAHGLRLPHLPQGCRMVEPGEVLLASATPKSLDGRYFGLTPIADLTAQALPLWTWR